MTNVDGVAGPDPSAGGEPGEPPGSPEPPEPAGPPPAAGKQERPGAGTPGALGSSGAGPPSGDTTQIPREVFANSPDPIVITDPDELIRAWNPATSRLYGIAEAAAIGHRIGELWSSFEVDGRPAEGARNRARLRSEGSWRGRLVQRPLVGEHVGGEVIVDSIATVLRDPTGTIDGILIVNRDVTAFARLEAEIATLGSLVVATDRARTKTEVATAALEILCRATGADGGLVTEMNASYEATAHRGVSQATIDVIVAYGQLGGPLAAALEKPDAYISADVETAPLRDDVRAAVIEDGFRHLQVVGLHLSGRLLGVLALGWRRPVRNPPSRAILQQAAALIAAALENARLLDVVERGLAQERTLTRRFRALVELTRLPDTAPDAGLGLERLVADIGEVVGADGSIFARVDNGVLVLVASDRVEPGWIGPLLERPLADVGIGPRLEAIEPPDVAPAALPGAGGPDVAPPAATAHRSIAIFPIREGDRLSGILLALFTRTIDELDIDDRTLEAIGRVLEISFVNRSLRQVVAASEARYRALFERSPDALLVETTDGLVVDANPAAYRLFGADLVGRRVGELIAGERRQVDPESEAFRRDGITNHVGIGRRLDGSTFPEEVDLHPLEIDGEPRILAIVRDMTERTRLQGELIQAQKMEAIGLLVAGVAHELNNPLASIVAFSQLIRTDPELPDELRHQADMLVQEANRTRVIVGNLLDFARARPPERVLNALRPLVDSVLGLQAYSFGKGGLAVVVDIPDDLPLIPLDRSQIQQVLVNLTVNAAQAIRATGHGGRLRIGAAAAIDAGGEPIVRIEVSDDGPGIPAEITDRLFMPFVTTKAPGQGTGLGLSVTFGIVTGHGGTLRHEPGPRGVGTTFIIELPLRHDVVGAVPADLARLNVAARSGASAVPAAGRGADPVTVERVGPAAGPGRRQPAGLADPADPGDAAGAAGRPIRVLVLDDEASIREFIGRALRRAGYVPILAPTGAEALELIRAEPPDAILCDHRMAGMNGTEFHDAVAAAHPALGRRFAFMSGDVLNPELRAFATARGIALLAKPFDIATIGQTVATLLGSKPAA